MTILALGTLFAWVALAGVAPAQEPTKIFVKIAVIDMQRIRRTAAVVKDIGIQIKAYRTAFQTDVRKEEKELRTANQELARQRTILAPEAFAAERRKFEEKLAAVQRSVQQRKQELDKVQGGVLQTVREALHGIILNFANENGLTLIFAKKQTILVAKPLEITDEILARLDKKLPQLKVAAPGQ